MCAAPPVDSVEAIVRSPGLRYIWLLGSGSTEHRPEGLDNSELGGGNYAMSALTVLIARHAEKPNVNEPEPGLTIDGNEDKKSLVVRGWQRAGAWAALLGAGLGGNDYPQPGVIYAANPNQVVDATDSGQEASKRPYETVKPLCDRLHLEPITKWGVGQEADLVSEISKLTGIVLVCWEHKHIVRDILPQIATGQTIPGLPLKWDGQRFDVVLRFDRMTADAPWSFRQLFPRLLAGDSDIPLGR
jgi:hypothetical protein